MTLQLNQNAIDFNLKGVNGNYHKLSDYDNKEIVAIIFSCNHCPYVVASEREFVKLQEKYQNNNFQLLAINTNSANSDYPTDSFDNMIKRANEKHFNFPYLDDADQSISRAYGAGRTPEIFLFNKDRKLVYHGRINDNPRNHESITRHDLDIAVSELLEGKEISIPQTQALGCSIKWIE